MVLCFRDLHLLTIPQKYSIVLTRPSAASIHVRVADPQLLKLIYPARSLYFVLHELITNSTKHSNDSAEVVVSWQMRAERFVCTVEDNGPGISANLSTTYLPVDALLPHDRVGEGLWLTGRVTDSSDGLLLFRRSSALGGTEVLIEFPVVGYWNGDDLRQFNDVYEH